MCLLCPEMHVECTCIRHSCADGGPISLYALYHVLPCAVCRVRCRVPRCSTCCSGQAILLDVRLGSKYEASHAAGSLSAPLYLPIQKWDVASIIRRAGFAFFGIYGTELNTAFATEVQQRLPKGARAPPRLGCSAACQHGMRLQCSRGPLSPHCSARELREGPIEGGRGWTRSAWRCCFSSHRPSILPKHQNLVPQAMASISHQQEQQGTGAIVLPLCTQHCMAGVQQCVLGGVFDLCCADGCVCRQAGDCAV